MTETSIHSELRFELAVKTFFSPGTASQGVSSFTFYCPRRRTIERYIHDRHADTEKIFNVFISFYIYCSLRSPAFLLWSQARETLGTFPQTDDSEPPLRRQVQERCVWLVSVGQVRDVLSLMSGTSTSTWKRHSSKCIGRQCDEPRKGLKNDKVWVGKGTVTYNNNEGIWQWHTNNVTVIDRNILCMTESKTEGHS